MSEAFCWSTYTGPWVPEADGRWIAELVERIPTVEDNYKRRDAECELEELRARHLRNCGRRWPEGGLWVCSGPARLRLED